LLDDSDEEKEAKKLNLFRALNYALIHCKTIPSFSEFCKIVQSFVIIAFNTSQNIVNLFRALWNHSKLWKLSKAL